MSDDNIIETIYGKYHKYEIVKKAAGLLSNVEFYIRKDGKPYKGPYNSLKVAVESAKKES